MKKVLLLLLLSTFLFSCGAKKKLTDRENKKTEEILSEKIDSISKSSTTVDSTAVVKKDSIAKKSSETVTVKDNTAIEVEGNGKDPITVEESIDNQGNKKVTVTGADKLKLTNEKSTETSRIEELIQKAENVKITLRKQQSKIDSLSRELEKYKNEESKRRTSNSFSLRVPIIVYIIGSILLLLLIFYLYRRYRKKIKERLNPF